MGRQGRICDPFDRITDAIVGLAIATDEELTEIWEDGPQSEQWKWWGSSPGGAPNSPVGCDINGAYVNTVSTAEVVTAQVGDEARSVIINYPCKIYTKFKVSTIQTAGSNRHILSLRLAGSDDDPEGEISGHVQIDVSVGNRVGSTIDGIRVVPSATLATVDLFAGASGGASRWFDGNDHSWASVGGGGTSGVWDLGTAKALGSILVKWHYGGAWDQFGNPGSVSGAAGPFVIEGSADGSTGWTTVISDANPVATWGASYPGDFNGTYSCSAEYRYYRWRSTTASNNDMYTLSAFAAVPTDWVPFAIVAGDAYWLSVDFAPGSSMGVRIWAAAGLEPDVATISLENEDGYSILTQIDDIRLIVNPTASAGKSWFQKFYVEGHCVMQDYSTDVEPLPALRQSHHAPASPGTGRAYLHLPAPAIAGNVLVAWQIARAGSTGATPSGWTQVAALGGALIASSTPNAGYLQVFHKVADGGEQDIQIFNPGGVDQVTGGILEFEGVTDIFSSKSVDNQSSTNHMILSGVEGTGGAESIVFVALMPCEPSSATWTFHTPDAGWTELYENSATDGYVPFTDLGPVGISMYKVDTLGAATHAPGTTNATPAVSTKWAGYAMVLV